jgi:hypothetical protein
VLDGVRIDNDTVTGIPADVRLRPLYNKLIVQPLDWRPSTILNVVYMGHPLRGVVLAAGPGRYPIRYNGRKGVRTKSWDSTVFVPNEVKVGDIVELGGLEIAGYLFHSFLWGDKRCIQVSEDDVTFIDERNKE